MQLLFILMMSIEAPWFYIMIGGIFELFSCLNVKITTFELKKTTFGVYLIMLSPMGQSYQERLTWIAFTNFSTLFFPKPSNFDKTLLVKM